MTPRRRSVSSRLRALRCTRSAESLPELDASAQQRQLLPQQQQPPPQQQQQQQPESLPISQAEPEVAIISPAHPPEVTTPVAAATKLPNNSPVQDKTSSRKNRAGNTGKKYYYKEGDPVKEEDEEEDEELPSLIPMEEELCPLPNMRRSELDDEDNDDDEDEESIEDEGAARVTPSSSPLRGESARSLSTTTTTSRNSRPPQQQEEEESIGARISHNHNSSYSRVLNRTSGGRPGSRLSGGLPSQSQQQQQQRPAQQVVFPAAPISPAHRVLVRGGVGFGQHGGGSSANHNNSTSAAVSQPTRATTRIPPPPQAQQQQPRTATSAPPQQQQESPVRTLEPPQQQQSPNPPRQPRRQRRTGSIGSVGSSSLGEMLRLDSHRYHNNSNHNNNSTDNGTSTASGSATGSNRSTDTATTATIANHARSSSTNSSSFSGDITIVMDNTGDELRPLVAQNNNDNENHHDNHDSQLTQPSLSSSYPDPFSSTQTGLPSTTTTTTTSDQQQQSQLQSEHYYNRRLSVSSTFSYDPDEDNLTLHLQQQHHDIEFYPSSSRHSEWMGRSIESLILGHVWPAPMLALEDGGPDDSSSFAGSEYMTFRRRSTASTFGGGSRRRSSQGSFPGGRRGSLSLVGNGHGGTMANYFSHRRRQQQQYQHAQYQQQQYHHYYPQPATDYVDRSYNEHMGRRGSATATGPMFRRRSSVTTTGSVISERSASQDGGSGDATENNSHGRNNKNNSGPNIILSILARESTGKASFARGVSASRSLRAMGGIPLFAMLDKPAAGIATEVAFLAAAIDIGDWTETHQIISRLTPRLTGDPMTSAAAMTGNNNDQTSRERAGGFGGAGGIQDANLPPTAPKFYAGGGRLGLERDAFCLAGGVQTMIRIFREKSFVGQEMSQSYDARDLSEEIVANRLAVGWNEALMALRELVYAIPALVENGTVLDGGDFLPFLFTLLAHDSCFEAAAALIEEILSFLSQAPQQASQQQQQEAEMDSTTGSSSSSSSSSSIPYYRAVGRVIPPTTFYLGNVPDLYRLWYGFNCRQLAHFCRILALVVFEPEDRQSSLSETATTTGVLKSIQLLQLRRNRAIRSGRDSTVDMNQAILLGDGELLTRLLKLLKVTNFAPSIRRFSPYHIMAHNPFIVDTLLMLGFSEFENWGEIDRQECLARDLLLDSSERDESDEDESDEDFAGSDNNRKPLVNQLGSIADWLEELSEPLNDEREPANQLLLIMTRAQRAGLVVGSQRANRNRFLENRRRMRRQNHHDEEGGDEEDGGTTDHTSNDATAPASQPSFPIIMGGGGVVDGTSMQGLASFAGMLTDQVLVRRLYQNVTVDPAGGMGDIPEFMSSRASDLRSQRQHPIQTALDAANSLQFNAMILGPYQVEILFVLCTFLGGKRKLDAQDQVQELGLIPVLEEMFERLPWYQTEPRRQGQSDDDDNYADGSDRRGGERSSSNHQQQYPSGMQGPGCECTPESALCVQYLRLLHNFCDRDCDNYEGRRLLLSRDERRIVFGDGSINELHSAADCKPGLLSKVIRAFINESDESPYRFWLASCIESYLRGSSAEEQVFLAKSGLLQHLVRDVSSERLHCSGSLQTSFDLLGELGKGNAEVFRLLVSELDEASFRKLMGVAATNLVDSNVFIRSLLLSLERLSAVNRLLPLYLNSSMVADASSSLFDWSSVTGPQSRSYLTHSWFDARSIALDDHVGEEGVFLEDEEGDDAVPGALQFRDEEDRQSDWFPSLDVVRENGFGGYRLHMNPVGLEESIGHNGWLFTPAVSELFSPRTELPNSIERLSWFLAAKQGRLLRDLLGVVDLRNINHENICCLNTAVVIAIFAHRRQQLSTLLQELKQMNDDERNGESNRALQADSSEDPGLLHPHHSDPRSLEQQEHTPYARSSPSSRMGAGENERRQAQEIGDGNDVLRNFREVLWFWREYYTHRGRDRLSLEFSSHLRFQEWDSVVSLLGSDDGSPLALVSGPVLLPRSPYQRAARGIAEHALLRGL